MAEKPDWFYRQSGVIPYRWSAGRLEVLLVTSRSKRWIIPKGIIDPELTPEESAAREAYEEAGVRGQLSVAIGRFERDKWGGTCTITVYPMRVDDVLPYWPEAGLRERRWVGVTEACRLVQDPGLIALLEQLPGVIVPGE
jgi:8-oxo-dGTP pyrophosphatase MutT (NUDIX family)